MPQIPCKFYQQGKCLKGDQCPFLHVKQYSPGELATIISNDMKLDRPLWKFSSYSLPARSNLLEGDLSPEEVQWMEYQSRERNELAQHEKTILAKKSAYDQAYSEIARDPQCAAKHLLRETNKPLKNLLGTSTHSLTFHPSSSPSVTTTNMSGFGQHSFGAKPTASSPFGQLGANKGVFGSGASAGSQPVFGSSTFGSGTNNNNATSSGSSPFAALGSGNTNVFGSGSSNAFGGNSGGSNGFAQLANNGSSSSVFGQTSTPSAFGQSSSSSAFGQSSSSSAFGQTSSSSAFGQPSSSSAFGQPSSSSAFGQPSSSSAFGQPSSGQSSTTFGSNTGAFGATGNSSAFGSGSSSSAFGQNNQQNQQNPFGGGTSGQSSFGQPSSSPFGNQQQPQPQNQSPFGQQSSSSAFGQSGNKQGQSPFGQSSNSSAFGQNNKSPLGTVSSNTKTSSNPFDVLSTLNDGGDNSSTEKNDAASNLSPFGQNQSQNTQNSPFGNANNQSQGAFGTQSQTLFGQNQNPNPFGQNQNQSPFGQNHNKSPFGQTQAQSSPFGKSATQNGSPFGQTQNQSSPFGQAPSAFGQQPASQSQAQGLFGSNGKKPQTMGATTTTQQSSGYKLFVQGANDEPLPNESDLSAEVLEQFQATKFVLGKIPELVPPLAYR